MTDLSQEELDKLLAEAGDGDDTGGGGAGGSGGGDGLAPEEILKLSAVLDEGWVALAGGISQSVGADVSVDFGVGLNTACAAVEADAAGLGVVVHFKGTVGRETSRHGLVMQDGEVAKLAAKIGGGVAAAELTADALQTVVDALEAALSSMSDAIGAATGEPVSFGAVSGINLADPAEELQMAEMGFVDALVRMEYELTVGDDVACPMLYLLPVSQARTLVAKAPAAKAQRASGGAVAADLPKATFPEFDARGGGGELPENIAIIMDIQLEVVARLGSVEMPIRDILKLGPGSIIDIDRPADGPVDLVVNDKLVARGDVVVVQENFGLRITEVQSAQERIASLR